MKPTFQIIRQGALFFRTGTKKTMFSLQHFRFTRLLVTRDNSDFLEREVIETLTAATSNKRLILSLFSPLTFLQDLKESFLYFFQPYRNKKNFKRDLFSFLTRIGKLALTTIGAFLLPTAMLLGTIQLTK